MTEISIRPGCFASALFYSVSAPECQKCGHAVECLARLRTRVRTVKERIDALDSQHRENRSLSVLKWISGRLRPDIAKERSSALKTALLDDLRTQGVNVYHLRHGTNPVEEPGSILHDLFGFMLEVGPFKPRDAVEHLRSIHDNESKASLERRVKSICEALEHAGVLKKEKHVLCLN